MKIDETKSGDVVVIEISGRLDTTNYQELETKLAGILDRKETNILLDIRKLEYVSSSGLRILLMYLKKIKALQGRLMLCSMSPEIREIFEISGFINIFEVYEDRAKALEA